MGEISSSEEDVTETFRLFLDLVDLSDSQNPGWMIIGCLADNGAAWLPSDYHGSAAHYYQRNASLFEKVTTCIAQDIKAYSDIHKCALIMTWLSCNPWSESCFDLWCRLAPVNTINETEPEGFTPLLELIASDPHKACLFLRHGADPTGVQIDVTQCPNLESPTSLAMYSGWAFRQWQHSLLHTETDRDYVIAKALENGPLLDAGWTRETLQRLFDWVLCPAHIHHIITCRVCDADQIRPLVQPIWLQALEQIRNGTRTEDLAADLQFGHLTAEDALSDYYQDKEEAVNSIAQASRSQEEKAMPRNGTTTTTSIDLLNDDVEQERIWPSETLDLRDDANISAYIERYRFSKHNVVCSRCWFNRILQGKYGTVTEADTDHDSSTDKSSEHDEFSPFHIHS